jgi:hypothetical protein
VPEHLGLGGKKWSGLIYGEILSAHDYYDEGVYLAWIAPGFCSFYGGAPPSSAMSGGAISDTG